MKKFNQILIFCLVVVNSFSQKNSSKKVHEDYWNDQQVLNGAYKNEIDPRQYVRVLYKKNASYKKNDGMEVQRIIWNWNDTGYFQKFKVLDNEGFLNIFFKKDSLAANYNFQGNISLEAYLKGKDGERKIEVGPYSLVGIERKEIGIESFPPTVVAQLLFNTVIEIKKTIVSVDFNRYDSNYVDAGLFKDDGNVFKNALEQVEQEHKTTLDKTIDKSDFTLQILNIRVSKDNYNIYYPKLKLILDNPENYKYLDLEKQLNNELKQVEGFIRYSEGKDETAFKRDLGLLSKELNLINTYLSSFQKAGPDAVQAFLSLASKDKINFNYFKNSLDVQGNFLSKILADVENLSNIKPLASRDNLTLALNILQNLRTLSSIEGSRLEALIKGYIKDSVIMKNAPLVKLELEEQLGQKMSDTIFSKYFLKYSDTKFIPNNFSRFIQLRLMERDSSFEEFKQKLSVMAATIIYKKLVFATIDLGKSGAQPGDILYLNVVWKNIDGDKDTANNNSSLLPIGKYYLRETGWKTEISESFYLVERINEPSKDAPNVSPSNFKGAYGASIMQTFHYNENYERTYLGRIMNRLQPSYGFNLSYVDFYTDKDIEIGVGLQLGLFKNVFFFGSGINLHSIRGDEKKSAAYFMFGVSFTNIAAKFKNSTSNSQPLP